MSNILMANSLSSVLVFPRYQGFLNSSQKVGSKYTTDTGAYFNYTWVIKERVKFTVSYVNSSFRSVVNDWWENNTDLIWIPTDVTSGSFNVRLVNKTAPISKLSEPYDKRFEGIIELGSF